MQWFTLSPRALDELRETTARMRRQVGDRDVGDRLNGMSEAQRGELASSLLTLLDEVEAILGRTRPEAPRKPKLPEPFAQLRSSRS